MTEYFEAGLTNLHSENLSFENCHEKEKDTNKCLNMPRRIQINRTAVVYGQTPVGMQRNHLLQMAKNMNIDITKLCKKIVNLSSEEQFQLLKRNYEKQNEQMKMFFDKFSNFPTYKSSNYLPKNRSSHMNSTCTKRNNPNNVNVQPKNPKVALKNSSNSNSSLYQTKCYNSKKTESPKQSKSTFRANDELISVGSSNFTVNVSSHSSTIYDENKYNKASCTSELSKSVNTYKNSTNESCEDKAKETECPLLTLLINGNNQTDQTPMNSVSESELNYQPNDEFILKYFDNLTDKKVIKEQTSKFNTNLNKNYGNCNATSSYIPKSDNELKDSILLQSETKLNAEYDECPLLKLLIGDIDKETTSVLNPKNKLLKEDYPRKTSYLDSLLNGN